MKQQCVDERLGFAVTNFHTWCLFGPKYDVTGLTKQFSLHMSTELQSSKLGTKEQYVQVKKNGISSELISASFYAQELINFEEIGDEG